MKKSYSSVFFGTPEFAIPSFQAAMSVTKVIAAITQPDRPRGRGQKLSPCPVKELAISNGILCFSPPGLRKASPDLEKLQHWMASVERPDFLLVTAYGNILPQIFLDWPKIGPVNVHASLLPRWRGAAPIQRAIEAGDCESGVSLQKMVFELDAGDILAESKFPIPNEMNSELLSLALSKLGGGLLEQYLESFEPSGFIGRSQNPAHVSFAKKIEKIEGYYSPEWTALETVNRIRAFVVWPGVKADFRGTTIKLIEAAVVDPHESLKSLLKNSLSSLIFENNAVYLVSYKDIRTREPVLIELKKIQFQGKAVSLANDALRNYFAQGSNLRLSQPTI